MRTVTWCFSLLLMFSCYGCARTQAGSKLTPSTSATAAAPLSAKSSTAFLPVTTNTATAPIKKVDFSTQIRPVLEAKCQPCHFSGGKVYERMPFDRGETVKTLGTKLFTRIKNENERRLISDFLAQQ